MNAFDLAPLLRTGIGFERINRVLGSMAEDMRDVPTYPPYNIEKTARDQYRVTMAVAGFGEQDLEIGVKEHTLTVRGKKDAETAQPEYLYRGIATREFERRFRLDEYVRVTGADLRDGLLHVNLVREIPEEKKPQRIAITNSGS